MDIEEIAPCMLRELIKATYVEAPDKSSGKRRQKIHIEYDGIGFIPLEELAKKRNSVTEVTPFLENSCFQAFFKIIALRSPA